MQDLGQWWRAGAEGEDGGEGVDFSEHALRKQVRRQLDIHDREHLIDKGETTMNTIHRTTDVTRTLLCQKAMESNECFSLAPGSVEKGGGQNIHSLHVRARLRTTCFGFVRGDSTIRSIRLRSRIG